jgi:hypothetical protein
MQPIRFPCAAVLLAAAPVASAQWTDTFEAYAVDSPIEGQGGWHNWDSLSGQQPFNRVVDATSGITPFEGRRMLRVVGSQLSGNLLSDSVHELNGPYAAGSGTWTFRTQVLVPSSFTGTTYVILMNEYADLGGPYDWAFQCSINSSSGMVHMDVFNQAAATLVHGDRPIVFDAWVELLVEVDLDNNRARSFYGGVEMWDFAWSDVLTPGGATAIDALVLFPNTPFTSEIYFDHMSLQPGSAGVSIGTRYCNANPNSTGAIGRIDAVGSRFVNANDVTLEATGLPNNASVFFLTSLVQGQVNHPGGSAGNLCLSGAIGRYVGPGQVQNTGLTGSASLTLDLAQAPTRVGLVPVVAGQTRHFQAWHSDTTPSGGSTSNFTDGISVTFR